MRRRLLLGLLPAVPLAFVCSGGCASEPVSIGLTMLAPQGLLDRANDVELAVFDAAMSKCEASGHAAVPTGDGVQRFTLDKFGCSGGAAWCKTIQLDKDGSKKMFAVVAKNAAGTVAEGCAAAVIDQDPIDVPITVKRFNLAACCGDGRVETGEQCDLPQPVSGAKCGMITGDAACAPDCRANEILLSIDDVGPPNLKNGAAKTKSSLAMSFGQGAPKYPNALRALFVDTSFASKGGSDVRVRFLDRALLPISDPPALAQQLVLPLKCSAVTGLGLLQKQKSPALAPVGDLMAVVYASDEQVGGIFDIYLSPQIADGCTDAHPCTSPGECSTGVCDQGFCAPAVQLNTSGAAPGADHPDVAGGPSGRALVTWTRANNVYGRIWLTTGELIPDAEILIASNASNARVAGGPGGWKVVYQSGPAVYLRTIGPSGAIGAATTVNVVNNGPQDEPDIAAFDDGRSVVVWHGGGDVYFQRFDAMGKAADHDQDAPLNTVKTGDQTHPVVAAGSNIGDFFAVAWETAETANISARFVGATTGFGYNSVTGQNDEFVATHPDIAGERHFPAVAVGGDGYVVIGWQDDSKDHHGIYARRFPPPAE